MINNFQCMFKTSLFFLASLFVCSFKFGYIKLNYSKNYFLVTLYFSFLLYFFWTKGALILPLREEYLLAVYFIEKIFLGWQIRSAKKTFVKFLWSTLRLELPSANLKI